MRPCPAPSLRPGDDDRRSKRIALTGRGVSAIGVIRDAVAEIEAGWTQELGRSKFVQLRGLLVELNELAD